MPSNIKEPISSGGSQPFIKHNIGSFIVLFPFYACNEDDVDVEKGEMVTVLNKDDPNWSWIIKKDSSEGFVPALFMCPIEILLSECSSQYVGAFNSFACNASSPRCTKSWNAHAQGANNGGHGEATKPHRLGRPQEFPAQGARQLLWRDRLQLQIESLTIS